MDGDYSVGLYTAGYRIPHIVLSLVTSMGVVMLPRCSNLIAANRIEEFSRVCSKALNLVLMVAFPATSGLILLSTPIIQIFCGTDFLGAVPVLYWTSPIILFIGLTNVIGIQMLYPLGKENIVIYSTMSGALVNLILNILLIPKYLAVGVGISTFAAELAVLFVQIYMGRKYIPGKIFSRDSLNYLVASIIMSFAVFSCIQLLDGVWSKTLISILLGVLIYTSSLLLFKDKLVIDVIKQIKIKIYGKI